MESLFAHEESTQLIACIVGHGVLITPLQGEQKQLLLVDEYQGRPLQLEVCEGVLVAVTSENRIRLWKIEQSEVKSSGLPSGRKVSIIQSSFRS